MPSRARLAVVGMVVTSLLLTLVARLWDVQVHQYADLAEAARTNQAREVVTPAVRGMVLDADGRPLASTRTSLDVTVDRAVLPQDPDRARDVVGRLADLLGADPDVLWARTRLCGEPDAPEPPACFDGSPYQPVPVALDVDPRLALGVVERAEDLPGVEAAPRAVRAYPAPAGATAAHLLGHLGPVTQAELDAGRRPGGSGPLRLAATDLVGRDGLEQAYDEDLRGVPGSVRLEVDHTGSVLGEVDRLDPAPGHHLLTTVDAEVQALLETSLADAVGAARTRPDDEGGPQVADTAAGVVLDVRTGAVVAMASYPGYDPGVWVGGVSTQEYAALVDPAAGAPLVDRAVAGQYPAASTFKPLALEAAVRAGSPVDARYDCPGTYRVAGRDFRNFRGIALGEMDLATAIAVSCDTVFYRFAAQGWQAVEDGVGTDQVAATAREAGLGRPTGVDLPGEAAGRVPDRAWKQQAWEQTRENRCAAAGSGYPDVAATEPARAQFLTGLATEQCTDGWRWSAGDAANTSIGQGDVLVTPLQLAQVYAALGAGGALMRPHVGRAVVAVDGTVVREVVPEQTGTLELSPGVAATLAAGLRRAVESEGTAGGAFEGWPQSTVPVAGKTGTAQVYGQQDTSWFAAYAPADAPRYAVVAMITQAGTGGSASAPAVRRVLAGLLGVDGGVVDPATALVAGPAWPSALPDGTPLRPPADPTSEQRTETSAPPPTVASP